MSVCMYVCIYLCECVCVCVYVCEGIMSIFKLTSNKFHSTLNTNTCRALSFLDLAAAWSHDIAQNSHVTFLLRIRLNQLFTDSVYE